MISIDSIQYISFFILLFFSFYIQFVESKITDGQYSEFEQQQKQYNQYYQNDHFNNDDPSKFLSLTTSPLTKFFSTATYLFSEFKSNKFNARNIVMIAILIICSYAVFGIVLSAKKGKYKEGYDQRQKKTNPIVAAAVALVNKKRASYNSKSTSDDQSSHDLSSYSSTSVASGRSKKSGRGNFPDNDYLISKKSSYMNSSNNENKMNHKNPKNSEARSGRRPNRGSNIGTVTVTRTSSPAPSILKVYPPSSSPNPIMIPSSKPIEKETIRSRNRTVSNESNQVQTKIFKKERPQIPQSIAEFSNSIVEHALENKFETFVPKYYDQAYVYETENELTTNLTSFNLNYDKHATTGLSASNEIPAENPKSPSLNTIGGEFDSCSSVLRSLSLFEEEEAIVYDP